MHESCESQWLLRRSSHLYLGLSVESNFWEQMKTAMPPFCALTFRNMLWNEVTGLCYMLYWFLKSDTSLWSMDTFLNVACAVLGVYPKKQLKSFPHPGNILAKTQYRLIPNLPRIWRLPSHAQGQASGWGVSKILPGELSFRMQKIPLDPAWTEDMNCPLWILE